MSATEAGVPRNSRVSSPAVVVGREGVRGRAILCAFSLLYASTLLAAAAANYLLYLAPRYDLGNMVQAVWSTSHGRFLYMSGWSGGDVSRLSFHLDPFLAFLVPLWWIWANPVVLIAAQALAVVSGVLPVYWLARKHVADHRLAVAFGIAYLLYPSTQFNTFTPIGIHAVSFAVPLILYAIWFLDEERLVWFALFGLLAATTKEEIAAAVGGLGIWYAVRRGRRLAGMSIFVTGYGLALANFLLVIPHFASNGQLSFTQRYANVGSTPGGMLRTAVHNPTAFIDQMTTVHKLVFVILLFVPFLGLWIFEPIMLVGALPDLAINLLSAKPAQTTVFYQYTAGIIPFVVAASILGSARLRRGRRAPALLVVAASCFALVSPLDYTSVSIHERSSKETVAIREALKLIPPDVPVSASQTLGAYVSTRRSVALFPYVGNTSWVIVGERVKEDPPTFGRTRRRLRASKAWKTVFDSAGITVFERRIKHKSAS
jgi:uncharacterized membrane protein